MSLTAKYKENYLPGFDCRMTTFRNNLAFYGYSLSNGMILGLSGCLTLIYATPEHSRIPYYSLVGITDQTLEGLSSVFDTYITRGECLFEPSHISHLITSNLKNDRVLNVAINRPLLHHFRQGGGIADFIIEPTNIGFHYLAVTAFDGRTITFFETDVAHPITCNIDEFTTLWFFDVVCGRAVFDADQRCNGKYYTLEAPGLQAHKSRNVLLYCLDKVCTSYEAVNKPYHHGVPGIHRFFKDMELWNADMDISCLVNSLFFMRILEANLSGGGFGRRLYSSFLAESADVFDDERLRSVARNFRASAKLWAGLIGQLCATENIAAIKAKNFKPLQSAVGQYAQVIVDAEITQFAHLREWINLKSI